MSFDILDQVTQTLAPRKISVMDFAQDPDFCGKKLYPAQEMWLKVFFLEELTGAEEDILTEWINGGENGNEVRISPNIRERIEWLRENGYSHFNEIVLVGGRRSSKGFITGITMANCLWNCLKLEEPGEYYGIDPEKDIYFSCIAASEDQAKKFQYADFSSTVEGCKAFEPHIVKSLETELRIATSADLRKINQAKMRGNRIQKDIARLRGIPLAANAGTLRGSATLVAAIDEAAHMIPGESNASADQVYHAIVPSLDQFGRDGLLFVNSSPYSKVGIFYDRNTAALVPFDPKRPVDERMGFEEEDGGANGNPRLLTLQFPSWRLYQGYQKSKNKFRHVITASPDWDENQKDENDEPYWSEEDIQLIKKARAEEAKDPDTYKVERRGKFAEVTEAFLNPEMVDRMFSGAPSEWVYHQGSPVPTLHCEPYATNYGQDTLNSYRYKFHLDPSSTTAGFGFAIAHAEFFDSWDGKRETHVIFDIIHRWDPKDFPDKTIRWGPILDEIEHYATIFRPFEITMDQFQSESPLQELNERLVRAKVDCRVYRSPSSNEVNWKRSQVFKTALYQGLIHAPYDTPEVQWCAQELKFLQENKTGGKFPKVDKQDIGPVQTKDTADPLHPSHEVLTQEGWKPIEDITTDDLVATRAANGKMTYHKPLQTIERKVKEELYCLENKTLDFCVTGNHNMLVAKPHSDEVELVEARHLLHSSRVPKTALLDREGPHMIEFCQEDIPPLPNLSYPEGMCQCGCKEKTPLAKRTRSGRNQYKGRPIPYLPRHSQKWTASQDRFLDENYGHISMSVLVSKLCRTEWAIYTRAQQRNLVRGQIKDRVKDRPAPLPPTRVEDFAAFVGFWLGDGRKIVRTNNGKSGTTGYRVMLSQTKPEGIEWVDNLMEKLGWPHKRQKEKNGETVWTIKSFELREYLYKLQDENSHELKLPSEVWSLWGRGSLERILEGLVWSDGSFNSDREVQRFSNTSLHLMEDVQRLLVHLGYRDKPITRQKERGDAILIKNTETFAKYDQWTINVKDKREFASFFRSEMKRIPYEGSVYCLTMPLGTFLTRRKGIQMWIGNCCFECVFALIGNEMANKTRERLTSGASWGSPGGYGIGFGGSLPLGGPGPPGISEFYSQRASERQMDKNHKWNAPRSAMGGQKAARRRRQNKARFGL